MIVPKSAGTNSALTPNFGHGVEQVDIQALDRLAVAGQELVGRVSGVGADLDYTAVLMFSGSLAVRS